MVYIYTIIQIDNDKIYDTWHSGTASAALYIVNKYGKFDGKRFMAFKMY